MLSTLERTIPINEIFLSIDGEVNYYGQGIFTTFIRTSGCNLNCIYCDTNHNNPRVPMTINQILDRVTVLGSKKVTITGGEPLLHSRTLLLLVKELHDNQYLLTIETNGTIPFSSFQKYAFLVVDYKFPVQKNLPISSFQELTNDDFLKFVIGSEEEFASAISVYRLVRKKSAVRVAFSPLYEMKEYPQWLLDKLCWYGLHRDPYVYMNFQIHKLVNLK